MALMMTVSCTYNNQKVELGFDLNNKVSAIGHYKKVEVVVVDTRENKDVIGEKKYSSEVTVKITPNQDIANFLQQKLTHNLISRGFQYGNDKTLTLKIESLFYKANRSLIGTSEMGTSFKIIIKDNKNGSIFVKNYNISQNNKHFIMPLDSTVADAVNKFLQDAVQEIVADDSFIENLIK